MIDYLCAHVYLVIRISVAIFYLSLLLLLLYNILQVFLPDIIATVDDNIINRNNVTLMLSWGEPFNNLDPIVSYTVSCSGDVTCPPNFTTTDNTTRSYTITNLTPMTNYTFSVVATNFIGSGEAGVVMITTPSGEKLNPTYVCTYARIKVLLALGVSTDK